MKYSILIIAFCATIANCQDSVDDDTNIVAAENGKGKRGISLNLGGAGGGIETYGYLGPSYSRGLHGYNGGYAPMTEYGYDGVNYGVGSQNFAGGYQGYNSPYGNYPYGQRGGYPTSYSYLRQYNTPINTNPYGGIGTVYPYGSGLSGAHGGNYGGLGGAGYNRLGYENGYY